MSKKFYEKTVKERIEYLKELDLFDEKLNHTLEINDANLLSENVVSTFELPMGVVLNFKVDEKLYHIPIVTEEPSVVAALNHAAKLTSLYGFSTHVHNRLMIGQIFFNDVFDVDLLKSKLTLHKSAIFDVAKNAHQSIYERGGGLKDFGLVTHTDNNDVAYHVLYVYIQTMEAFGANIINTILESVANYLREALELDVLMAILTNLATESLVTATCKIPVSNLKGTLETAKRIEKASTFASLDIYRAATHNKGIMNGIHGLFLATGNDTRAIEAACHSYASMDGYKPLSTWKILDDHLVGHLTIPAPIGSVGKQMNILSKARLAHKILGNPSALDLMRISASVGLAQNFAALYALTTDGIQKGHMALHNRINRNK